MQIIKLRDEINRGLDFGAIDLTKSHLHALSDGDLSLAYIKLQEWQSRGLLEILKNPFSATDDEVCIHMLNYIDKESPWPNFPLKKDS